MPKEKFQLSQTIRFLAKRLNVISGAGEATLAIELDPASVQAGHILKATLKLRNVDKPRTLDYLAITMEGKVQRDGAWRAYTEGAEVAQNTKLQADHELVIPLELYVPEDAVLSRDGAPWRLEARAVLDRLIDPLARVDFEVLVQTDPSPFATEEE